MGEREGEKKRERGRLVTEEAETGTRGSEMLVDCVGGPKTLCWCIKGQVLR